MATNDEQPKTPEPGTDSRVEDWFGQSVDRDAQLADEVGGDEAEFERRATGEAEQDARHGDTIDPDQGQSAYQDDPE